ncbi:MAG: peroxidase family protein [Gemmataceae bacterium]
MAAEIQVITYKEWLPALPGPNALRAYRGYNANVNPGISNSLDGRLPAAHHDQRRRRVLRQQRLSPITFTYVNERGETVTIDGEVALSEAFFNPTLFGQIRGERHPEVRRLDPRRGDGQPTGGEPAELPVRQPGQGGLDLAGAGTSALAAGTTAWPTTTRPRRAAFGLPRVTSFAQITSDVELQQKLQQLYGSVNNIDLWAGAMAEDHVAGSSTGPLVRRILADQFERLRDGDRFWYQRAFSGTQLAALERTTLSDVIERNSGVRGLQDNVFFFKAQVQGLVFADPNGNGRLDRGEAGLGGVRVELLNDEGEVIASALTDRVGRYSFDQFGETGDYSVRMVVPAGRAATTANPREFLISAGDVVVRGVNFGLRPAATVASLAAGAGRSQTSPAGDGLFEEFAALVASLPSSDKTVRVGP